MGRAPGPFPVQSGPTGGMGLTARRWTEKAELDPASVRPLDPGHPALTENRTLFPRTVVEVTASAPERLLVSGRNNVKLGDTVAKGRLAGFALYGLSLEERATCPASCAVRDVCYGNGMHLARRHRIGDRAVFQDRIEDEVRSLLREHRAGVLVRLHVLGDFPSPEYVAFWDGMLANNPRLACYGYTHRATTANGGDAIGDAIAEAKAAHPDRFRIRWSSPVPVPDGAVVIDRMPEGKRVPEGIVCPAQTDATACCSSCGLCWEPAASGDSIAFIKHGPKSRGLAAEAAMRSFGEGDGTGSRRIAAVHMPPNMKPAPLTAAMPSFRIVAPASLLVEESYQRDLSARSIKLIRRIVTHWDWAKFKPPVCAETPDGLFVIDGQHTSIAAATHPGIAEIPVIVIDAAAVATRADAFVAHNRDRVAISELQIFLAEVAAGAAKATSINAAVEAGGGRVPRMVPVKGKAKPGDVIAMGALRRVHGAHGPAHLERIVRIAVAAGVRPINSTVILGLNFLLSDSAHAKAATRPDAEIAASLAALATRGEVSVVCQQEAAIRSMNRYKACAGLLADAILAPAGAAPANDFTTPPLVRPSDRHVPEPRPVGRTPEPGDRRWERWLKPKPPRHAGGGIRRR